MIGNYFLGNGEFEMRSLPVRELKVIGSRINPDTHGRAAALINSGRISLEKLITHSYPADRLKEAIIRQTEDDSIKVIIEP